MFIISQPMIIVNELALIIEDICFALTARAPATKIGRIHPGSLSTIVAIAAVAAIGVASWRTRMDVRFSDRHPKSANLLTDAEGIDGALLVGPMGRADEVEWTRVAARVRRVKWVE